MDDLIVGQALYLSKRFESGTVIILTNDLAMSNNVCALSKKFSSQSSETMHP